MPGRHICEFVNCILIFGNELRSIEGIVKEQKHTRHSVSDTRL